MNKSAPLLILLVFLALLVNSFVFANPIPAPTIILDREDITFNFTYLGNGVVSVSVYGKYTMRNAGYAVITMYFPVPNETDRESVRVLVNGKEMSYGFTWDMIIWGHKYRYYTVKGPLPLITWSVMGGEEKYVVEVYYNYKFNIRNGFGETIYALGTGKYYYTYSKQCIATININLKGFNNTLLNIILDAPNQTETLVYAKLINKPIRTSIVLASNRFSSFKRDLWFMFKQINPNNYMEGYVGKIHLRIDPLLGMKYLKIHGSAAFNSGGYMFSRLELVTSENEVDLVMNIIQIKGPAAMIIKEVDYELYAPLNISETGKLNFKLIVNERILVNKTLNCTRQMQPLVEESIVQKPINNSTIPIQNQNTTTTNTQHSNNNPDESPSSTTPMIEEKTTYKRTKTISTLTLIVSAVIALILFALLISKKR
ncbi:hypothetical protein Shell_1265 [Staphylothermus hellenicus DSM 12710]|uniref:Uncharacterized protein n=1 Tax=Staphylothermus hellenicus (strain DSM 12710 / JCM 10830 / BK20S6-10-b1 / P8) TaxID=591019 RepID=D7D9B5_STAHD|nr:hypothetical protein [Staphylothermus hellenicus]ADI32361.1 hypothetical protein Shell_1265 [Staphylothermus hellenicus DSM 12710]